MSISIIMFWRPLRLGPSRHSSFIISSAHERKMEICVRMISSWLDFFRSNAYRAMFIEGQSGYFSDYKRVTNERACERLRHRALSWWLILWMLCNRRSQSAAHTSQLLKNILIGWLLYFTTESWMTVWTSYLFNLLSRRHEIRPISWGEVYLTINIQFNGGYVFEL